jgi:uncharacterized protein YecE (DUF72 family)
VKLPKHITHVRKLIESSEALEAYIDQVGALGEKLAVLLVQLPPKQAFDQKVATNFFEEMRARSSAHIACEPRHPSWFEPAADALLARLRVARVAADPACVPEAAEPGGWRGLSYYRLHGSPRIYYSAYSEEYLDALASRVWTDAAAGRNVWCIFDNTTLGAATGNALTLQALMR